MCISHSYTQLTQLQYTSQLSVLNIEATFQCCLCGAAELPATLLKDSMNKHERANHFGVPLFSPDGISKLVLVKGVAVCYHSLPRL